jgi:hypothetical protein
VNTDIVHTLSIQRRSLSSVKVNWSVDTNGVDEVELNGKTYVLGTVAKAPGLKRTILTRREREVIGEAIDLRFRSIQREQPKLASYLIYAMISEESEEMLGQKIGPRKIEGRHHRYQAFMEKRSKKNSRL